MSDVATAITRLSSRFLCWSVNIVEQVVYLCNERLGSLLGSLFEILQAMFQMLDISLIMET